MKHSAWRLGAKCLATLLLMACAVAAFMAGFAFNLFGRVFLIFLLPGFALSLAFLFAAWRLWRAPQRSIFSIVMIALAGMWVGLPLAYRLYQAVVYRDFGTPIEGHANAIELVYEGYTSPSQHVFSLGYAFQYGFSELRVGNDVYMLGATPRRYVRKRATQDRPRYRVTDRAVTLPEKSWLPNWPGRGDVEISVLDTASNQEIGRWNGPTKDGWRGPMAGSFLVDLLRPEAPPRVLRDSGIPAKLASIKAATGEWHERGRVPLNGCPANFRAGWDLNENGFGELDAGGWYYGALQGETSVVCNADGIFVFSFYDQGNKLEAVHLASDGRILAQTYVKLPQADGRLHDMVPMVEQVALNGDALTLRTLYHTVRELSYVAEIEVQLR